MHVCFSELCFHTPYSVTGNMDELMIFDRELSETGSTLALCSSFNQLFLLLSLVSCMQTLPRCFPLSLHCPPRHPQQQPLLYVTPYHFASLAFQSLTCFVLFLHSRCLRCHLRPQPHHTHHCGVEQTPLCLCPMLTGASTPQPPTLLYWNVLFIVGISWRSCNPVLLS